MWKKGRQQWRKRSWTIISTRLPSKLSIKAWFVCPKVSFQNNYLLHFWWVTRLTQTRKKKTDTPNILLKWINKCAGWLRERDVAWHMAAQEGIFPLPLFPKCTYKGGIPAKSKVLPASQQTLTSSPQCQPWQGPEEKVPTGPASGGLRPGAEESVQHILGQESRCLLGQSIDREKMHFMKEKYK